MKKIKVSEEAKLHLSHYFALVVILNMGIAGFLLFSPNRFYQACVVTLTSLTYVAWGIIHHWICEDLHLKVVLEYVMVTFLADLMLFSLLFWG